MASAEKALEADVGFLVSGAAGLFSSPDDPALALLDAPQGSLYLRTNNLVYVREAGGWVRAELPPNFSYSAIEAGDAITIKDGQQMLLYGPIRIDGQLNVLGSLVMHQVDEPPPPQTIYPENFSYRRVLTGEILQIPEHQQMVVVGGLTIEGQLELLGDLALISATEKPDPVIPPIPPPDPENFSYATVPPAADVLVPTNQQMVVVSKLEIFGGLTVEGALAVIGGGTPTAEVLDDEFLPPYWIEANEVFTVKARRYMRIPRLILNGQLNVLGWMEIT